MPAPITYVDAVVSAFASGLAVYGVTEVLPIDQKFDKQRDKKVGPSVLVLVDGGGESDVHSPPQAELNMLAFVQVQRRSKVDATLDTRGDYAMFLAFEIMKIVQRNEFAGTVYRLATKVRVENATRRAERTSGISLWVVGWRQRVKLESITPGIFGPLEAINTSAKPVGSTDDTPAIETSTDTTA